MFPGLVKQMTVYQSKKQLALKWSQATIYKNKTKKRHPSRDENVLEYLNLLHRILFCAVR